MTDWDDEAIERLISEVVRSYSFASGDKKIKKLFHNLIDYWNDYGCNFEVVKTSHAVSLEVSGYDINGVIDLVINDGEGVSLLHFIRTRDLMKNFHSFYMTLLNYYAIAYMENEDVNVVNLILYVLDESKLYEIEFNPDNFVMEYLESVVSNIDSNDFIKHKVNCGMCEFSSLLCKTQ